MLYLSLAKCGRSASHELREQTDFPHLGSSCATVKAGVTKYDARVPSKRHAISRAFNTTPGRQFRHHTLHCEESECQSLQGYVMMPGEHINCCMPIRGGTGMGYRVEGRETQWGDALGINY